MRRAGFALAATVALAAVVLPRTPAIAADGACSDDRGVTVVVDGRDAGGGLSVRCAPTAGGNGLDALKAAGHSVSGTSSFGESLVCRIDNLPSASQTLDLDGNSGYREQCVNTPPAGATWAYWYADNGGSWQFSQSGPKSRTTKPGGFEGWRFELNRGSGTVAPGVAPRRQTAGSSAQPPGAEPTASTAPSSGSTALPAPKPRHGSKQSAAPTTGPSSPAPDSTNTSAPAQDEDAKSSTGIWLAGGAVVVLLALVTITTVRRRRTRGDG